MLIVTVQVPESFNALIVELVTAQLSAVRLGISPDFIETFIGETTSSFNCICSFNFTTSSETITVAASLARVGETAENAVG